MEFKIDEKMAQEAINNAANKAIESAFSQYSVARVIESEVAGSVISDVLQRSVSSAVEQIDINRLSTVLAEELSRTVVKGVTYMIRSALVEMMLDIEKVPSYDEKKRAKARAEIEARVFNGKKNVQ